MMDTKSIFNLDDLDAETRALAVSAARRDGITPEEWIQRVIMRRIAATPAPAAETPPAPPSRPEPAPAPQTTVRAAEPAQPPGVAPIPSQARPAPPPPPPPPHAPASPEAERFDRNSSRLPHHAPNDARAAPTGMPRPDMSVSPVAAEPRPAPTPPPRQDPPAQRPVIAEPATPPPVSQTAEWPAEKPIEKMGDEGAGVREPDSIQSQLEALARAAESGRFRPSGATPAEPPIAPPSVEPGPDWSAPKREPREASSEERFSAARQDFEDSDGRSAARDPTQADSRAEGFVSVDFDLKEFEVGTLEPEDDGPSADNKAAAGALDALASRVSAGEQNLDEILSPLEQAVRGLERQLESIEHGDTDATDVRETPATPAFDRHMAEASAKSPDRQGRDEVRETATDLLAMLETMNSRMEAAEHDRTSPQTAEAKPPRPSRDMPFGTMDDAPEAPENPLPRRREDPRQPQNKAGNLAEDFPDPIAPLRTAAGRDIDKDDSVLELNDLADDEPPAVRDRREAAAEPFVANPRPTVQKPRPDAAPDAPPGAGRDDGRRVDWFQPIEERPERFEHTGSSMRILRAVILAVVLAGALAIAAWFYLRGDETGRLINELERLTENPGAIFERGTPPRDMAEPEATAAPQATTPPDGGQKSDTPKDAAAMQGGESGLKENTGSGSTAIPAPPPTPAPETATAPPPPPAPLAMPQSANRPPITDSLEDRIAWLKDASQRGNSSAQHDLAVLYAQSNGLEQDYRSAAYWFREAAVQGIANAQYNLGVLHERGLGVQQDPLESLLWYLSAAEQGHAAAQYSVGVAYAEGKGIPQNYPEAIKWFEKSAAQGLPRAQYNLGIMFEDGLGGTPDLVEAARWYAIAARRGEADAQERFPEIKAQLTAEEAAEVERLVAATEIATQSPASPGIPAANPGAAAQDEIAPLPPSRPASGGATDQSQLAEIQTILNRLNFDAGPADGLMGDRTRFAIRKYQTTMRLDVTGEPSQSLLENLREVAGR
jgi:TPR repeat protein